jgi:hypothetical protein
LIDFSHDNQFRGEVSQGPSRTASIVKNGEEVAPPRHLAGLIQIGALITPIGECQSLPKAHIMIRTEHLYGTVHCHFGDSRTCSWFQTRVMPFSIAPIKEQGSEAIRKIWSG